MVSTKRTILVVEDDSDTSDLILTLLSLHGYAMRVANDRTVALQLLREHEEPDTMILDCYMSGQPLEEFVTEARQRFPSLSIVLISSDDGLREIASELKVAHYLRKPFMPEALVRLIDGVVQQKYGHR